MLTILVTCILILLAAGVGILLIKTLLKSLDADVLASIRVLILVVAGIACLVTLWNGRGAFGVG